MEVENPRSISERGKNSRKPESGEKKRGGDFEIEISFPAALIPIETCPELCGPHFTAHLADL